MSTVADVRREEIKNLFIANPSTYISTNTLADKYRVTPATIRNDFEAVRESLNGDLTVKRGIRGVVGSGGYMFVPRNVEDEASEDKVKSLEKGSTEERGELLDTLYGPEGRQKIEWGLAEIGLGDSKKSPWVNHEGYSDPTVKKALENVPNETCRFTVGSVWDTTANSKAHELVMVVRADAVKPIVLPLFEKDEYKTEGNEEYTRKITYGSYIYYTDIRCLRTKPAKYFLDKQFVIEKAKLEGLLLDISRLFTEGNPLLQRRVDVLEKQADKYRIMINDLREQLEKAQKDNEHLAQKNASMKKTVNELYGSVAKKPAVEDDVKIALALQKQKIDIYEGILKSLGLVGKA